MNWYLTVLKNYAQFSGRARRSEYWYFVLFNMIISIVLSFVDGMIGTFDLETGVGLLSGVYALLVFIPSLAVAFRRLHDTGRSAWGLLLFFIPLIGAIVILIFLVQDSKDENEYGISPKLVAQ